MTLRVAVAGAAGRMGAAVLEAATMDTGVTIARRLGRRADAERGLEVISIDALRGVDVAIDFSSPAGTRALAEAATHGRVPCVFATTGLDDVAREAVDGLARVAPCVVAPNTSVGVALVDAVLAQIARITGAGWDVELVESHHRRKRDAPSGTALLFAETIARARGADPDAAIRVGRGRGTEAREAGAIVVHSVRGGDIVGEHSVRFLHDLEHIEVLHRASSRRLFAEGALRAARWVREQPPGRYSMRDVLGLPA